MNAGDVAIASTSARLAGVSRIRPKMLSMTAAPTLSRNPSCITCQKCIVNAVQHSHSEGCHRSQIFRPSRCFMHCCATESCCMHWTIPIFHCNQYSQHCENPCKECHVLLSLSTQIVVPLPFQVLRPCGSWTLWVLHILCWIVLIIWMLPVHPISPRRLE